MTASTVIHQPTTHSPRPARFLLWFTLLLTVFTTGVGRAWDAMWHITYEFDSFFSPPHLFTYSFISICGLLVGVQVLAPSLRAAFSGPTYRVSVLPFRVPGALVLLGSGFLVLLLAGSLDAIWHTTFGLDETQWSTPHNMIGAGMLVIGLGFMAALLALQPDRPLGWLAALFIGWLVLGLLEGAYLGPLFQNNTLDSVQAVSRIPVLSVQEPFQHTARIYTTWNLTREHPLFIPLAALTAGLALGLIRRFERRTWLFLLIALTLTLLSSDRNGARFLDRFYPVSDDPATWLPTPIFPMALTFAVLSALRLRAGLAWGMAGLVYGLLALIIWGSGPVAVLLTPLAALLAPLGARLGATVYTVLVEPTRRRVLTLVLIAGIALPFATGLLDLLLRTITP